MAQQVTRRWWLLAGLSAHLCLCVSAQPLFVRVDGDQLHVSAPQLHFLTGKPLERLHNGSSVAFAFQLTLSTNPGTTVIARAADRFIVSYDLWEEKFAVMRRRERRSGSHLTAGAAESWCLDHMVLNTAGLADDKPFWVRLEMRAEDPKDEAGVVDEPGINLTRLVEIFSRPPKKEQPRWVMEAGPLKLADLRKAGARGSGPG